MSFGFAVHSVGGDRSSSPEDPTHSLPTHRPTKSPPPKLLHSLRMASYTLSLPTSLRTRFSYLPYSHTTHATSLSPSLFPHSTSSLSLTLKGSSLIAGSSRKLGCRASSSVAMATQKKVDVFDSKEDLAVQLAKYTADLSDKFTKERGSFTVVLSGGSLIDYLR